MLNEDASVCNTEGGWRPPRRLAMDMSEVRAQAEAMRKKRLKNSRVATITEVALHADVSVSTVSRVVNGASNVLDETKARVMRSIEALGYIPNTAAQSLAGKG